MSDTPDGIGPNGISVDDAAANILAMLGGPEEETRETGETPDEPVEEDVETDELEQTEEPEEPDKTDEGEPEPVKKFRVKVDGEELEVTEDELLKGYSRTQDYTRKTQAAAEERKAAATERETLQRERQTYAQSLAQMQQIIAAQQQPQQNLEWLRVNDPAQYAVALTENLTRQQQLTQLAQERARVEAMTAQEQEQSRRAQLSEEAEKLFEKRPDWRDPDKAAKARADIVKAIEAVGYSADDMNNTFDHRAYLLAELAAKYLALEAKAKVAKPTPKTEQIRTVKPGSTGQVPSRKAAETKAAQSRLARSGSVDDAAAIFANMI